MEDNNIVIDRLNHKTGIVFLVVSEFQEIQWTKFGVYCITLQSELH